MTAREVVLLFPGQGAQYPGMAVDLYLRHRPFRTAMDEVFELYGGEGDAIRADWLGADPVLGIDDLRRSQPLLFAIDHALAVVVLAAGVRPVALLGHSVGEVAAAVIAGVMTLPEAAAMIIERVAQLAGSPAGGMLAVAASVAEVGPLLGAGVAVAAVNGARQIMVAGLAEALDEARLRLLDAGFTTQRVRANAAFHSPVLAPYTDRCLPSLRAMTLAPPAIPLYSAYTGRLLTDDATEPGFWASQPASTVFFADALEEVGRSGTFCYLETGPGQLAALVRRHPRITRAGGRASTLLPARVRTPAREVEHLAEAVDVVAGKGKGGRVRRGIEPGPAPANGPGAIDGFDEE